MEMPQIYRPTPRRPFDISPSSEDSSVPPSPAPEKQNPLLVIEDLKNSEAPHPPSRTRSILNLTSSTLLGIYSNTVGDGARDDAPTPWGTGARTPLYRHSTDQGTSPDLLSANWNKKTRATSMTKPRAMSMKKPRSGFRRYYFPLFWRTCCLFLFGMAFGLLVTQLQKTQKIAPVPIPSFATTSWVYQMSWGFLGVIIGNALPQIDALWDDGSAIEEGDDVAIHPTIIRSRSNNSDKTGSLTDSGTGPFWYSAVRSVGAFVGIAFAVRKIPWQSTLQVSLTLAIANPVLWYLIDRSRSGFTLSSITSILGAFLLLVISPDFVPMPAIHHDQEPLEKFGVYTWLASILFCTSLCFGAIGRKLQLQ